MEMRVPTCVTLCHLMTSAFIHSITPLRLIPLRLSLGWSTVMLLRISVEFCTIANFSKRMEHYGYKNVTDIINRPTVLGPLNYKNKQMCQCFGARVKSGVLNGFQKILITCDQINFIHHVMNKVVERCIPSAPDNYRLSNTKLIYKVTEEWDNLETVFENFRNDRESDQTGSMISYEQINDIDRKLSKFQQLIGTIKRTLKKKVRTDTILKFYKTMAIPTLTYGSETWCMTTQMKRIEAAEMRLLRPIAGYSLLDHKRNEDIRQELNMPNIIETITEYRNKWHEHICTMEPTRIPYRLHHYKLQGRRRIGRPRKRWKDQF
ncbi:hypothetical protein ANN_02550 [Periplaneta americana]|uniref:Endonuclease-reverse transcriptase n=1 Tax=Periplaneta americana TaxID=6978 RepID=A0ABQ8U105_PERAM|nr:hypothetical protein ANN_02550 [Periplaneta americana]